MNVFHPGGRAVLSSGDEGILDSAGRSRNGLDEFRVGGKVLGLGGAREGQFAASGVEPSRIFPFPLRSLVLQRNQ